jgi:ribonuclease III
MRPTEQAFIHSSFANENEMESNERLEFIGDSVLSCIIANYLYNRYPDKDEGFLTTVKTNLVNNAALANAARSAKLERRILLGRGAEKNGERHHLNVLADCFEAYVGALFMEYGMEKATSFIMQHIDKSAMEQGPDPKTRLNEYAQSIKQTVNYEVVGTEGLNHEKVFEVKVTMGTVETTAKGTSIKAAQKEAASIILKGLGI